MKNRRLILGVCFIILIIGMFYSILGKGYVGEVPIIRLLSYIVIPLCLYNGITIMFKKENGGYSKLLGVANVAIGLYILVLAIQGKLFA